MRIHRTNAPAAPGARRPPGPARGAWLLPALLAAACGSPAPPEPAAAAAAAPTATAAPETTPPPAPPEDFAEAFARMQADPTFLASRAAPDLHVIEHFAGAGPGEEVLRFIPCDLATIDASGWRMLPDPAALAGTGVEYAPPETQPDGRVVVLLGPPDSRADGRYHFVALDGRWHLARAEVFSMSPEPGEPEPPLPCPG